MIDDSQTANSIGQLISELKRVLQGREEANPEIVLSVYLRVGEARAILRELDHERKDAAE